MTGSTFCTPPCKGGKDGRASVEDVLATSRVDGLPQRIIENEQLSKLESSSAAGLLILAGAHSFL